MVINKSNIMMIKEIIITPLDITCKHITDFTCVRTIDRTAAIKDKIVDETIDTKVSSATCFSVLAMIIKRTAIASNGSSYARSRIS